MKYIVSSGWWCAGQVADTRAELLGDDAIREQAFHQLWYEAINRYASPEKILIVDSCSPVKPQIDKKDERLEFVSLNVNAGHSTNHIGQFCGYSRAILLGLEYAIQCETDYFVYVEQDALIYGDGIIEHCIESMRSPYMFGSGRGTPGIIQQSFFIIRRDGIRPFLKRIRAIAYTDHDLSPEFKFHIAAGQTPLHFHAYLHRYPKRRFSKWLAWQLKKHFTGWDELPVGYGRARPINFDEPFYYFQHGSSDELSRYQEIIDERLSTNLENNMSETS